MRGPQLLLTGDTWHADFRELVRDFRVPITLVGWDQVGMQLEDGPAYSALVVCESRRGQAPRERLIELRDGHPLLPIVVLQGSWCEGEARSGEPVAGLIRVYWHQWRGQFQWFLHQLAAGDVADWQMPRTRTLADLAERLGTLPSLSGQPLIGISAWSADGYRMMADAIDGLEGRPFWLEQQGGLAGGEPACLILLGNSFTRRFESRLARLRENWPRSPVLAVLNFPRANERSKLQAAGVTELLSQPFSLSELAVVLASICHSRLEKRGYRAAGL